MRKSQNNFIIFAINANHITIILQSYYYNSYVYITIKKHKIMEKLKLVKEHFGLRQLNLINFQSMRLRRMDEIEREYMINNQTIIFDDEYYKELLKD